MALKLNLQTLPDLPAHVAKPGYDRTDLSAGIVHIGVGNFHRAHMAVYLDELFALGRDHDWAIVGAGIKSFDAERREILKEQDWLTTVIELAPEKLSAHVTGAMIDFCEVVPEKLIARLSDPAIRIVSLTITEGGYFVDAKTGNFDASHPAIQQDAARSGAPETVFGILIAGLEARRAAGIPPFTILSCDNLPENGHVTARTVCGLAQLISPDLAEWIKDNVAFPNSMVDCITPATSDRERAMARDEFGVIDGAPVVSEPFRQWVMEDNFPLGRPRLEDVGVTFVDDVTPYETMKLRILNAGHATIAYPGALLGHIFVHDAMADPLVSRWLQHLVRTEVIPILPPITGTDFDGYLMKCIDRFENPRVGDTIARLCQDGSNRQPKFVLPSIRDALATGRPVDLLAYEVAFWCRYCAGESPENVSPALADERAHILHACAWQTRDDPESFLRIKDVFGDLSERKPFTTAFSAAISNVWAHGTHDTLVSLINKA